MPRLNGLQHSKTNQVGSLVLTILMIGLLVFFLVNGASWWAAGAAMLLIAFGGVVFLFSRKPQQ